MIIGKEPITVDPKILALIHKDYNTNIEQAEIDIKRNKFNNLTTTYYLISKRKERAGIFRQQYIDEQKRALKKRVAKNGENKEK